MRICGPADPPLRLDFMDIRPSHAKSTTVAIVDDDAAVLNALSFALETEGYVVQSYRTAGAMFAALQSGTADCLVIDQHLPDESGIDLLTRLRARGDRAPAVIITTNPGRTLRSQAEELCAPLVEKPLLGDQLFACIRALTRRQ